MKTDDDELEAELAQIVLERVESQRREAGEHMLRQVSFRLQYLKPIEGVRVEFGRITVTLIAQRDGTCRMELMHNEGSLVNVETHEALTEAELPERFRQIMHAVAAESERPQPER